MQSRRRITGVTLALVVMTTLAGVHVSRADAVSIAHAEAAYARGALREANRLFLASLREPGHTREELVRIHLHLGIIAGASGAERTSQAHFAIALAIDPALPVPAELAGRDRSRFEQARPAHPLTLSVEATPGPATAGALSLMLRLAHAPPRGVDHVELACAGTSIPVEPVRRGGTLQGGRASIGPDTCPGAELALVATARNSFGGVLAHHEARIPRPGSAR